MTTEHEYQNETYLYVDDDVARRQNGGDPELPNNTNVTLRQTNSEQEVSPSKQKRRSRYDDELYAMPDVSEASSSRASPSPDNGQRKVSDSLTNENTGWRFWASWKYANGCTTFARLCLEAVIVALVATYFVNHSRTAVKGTYKNMSKLGKKCV